MKRTAIVLGVAAALAVPSVAPAASKPSDVVMVKPQVAKVMVAKPQIAKVMVAKRQVAKVQVATRHNVSAARVRALGTKIVLTRLRY